MSSEWDGIDPMILSILDDKLEETGGPIEREELTRLLDLTKGGQIRQTLNNCVLIFMYDPVLYGKFKFNLLAQRIDVCGEVPWKRVVPGVAFSNCDLRGLHLFFEKEYEVRAQKLIDEALKIIADNNSYHPIRDYLNKLQWDGKSRIRDTLHRYLGADTNDYTYEVFKLFLLAAVSRIFEPGIKFDYMLCLVGAQGIGKSTFIRFLAINDEWFCDDLKNLESDKVYETLMGHWIVEMSEMIATINAKTTEAIKSFMSRQKETYRTPYEKVPEDRPRQCVFVGTTNKKAFLPYDRTGNRRFLPVQCHEDQVEEFILDNETAARAYIDQLWAEVMSIYKGGDFQLKLSAEIEKQAQEYQQEFLPEDTDAGAILSFMQETDKDRVCSLMLFCEALNNQDKSPTRRQTNEICEIVNLLIQEGKLKGWKALKSSHRFAIYGTQRGWEKIAVTVNEGTSTGDGFIKIPAGMKTPFD